MKDLLAKTEILTDILTASVNHGSFTADEHDRITATEVCSVAQQLYDPTHDHSRKHQFAQIYIKWHEDLMADCSEAYELLRTENPGASKADLNADTDLFALNIVRRSVRAQRGNYTH